MASPMTTAPATMPAAMPPANASPKRPPAMLATFCTGPELAAASSAVARPAPMTVVLASPALMVLASTPPSRVSLTLASRLRPSPRSWRKPPSLPAAARFFRAAMAGTIVWPTSPPMIEPKIFEARPPDRNAGASRLMVCSAGPIVWTNGAPNSIRKALICAVSRRPPAAADFCASVYWPSATPPSSAPCCTLPSSPAMAPAFSPVVAKASVRASVEPSALANDSWSPSVACRSTSRTSVSGLPLLTIAAKLMPVRFWMSRSS